MQQAADVRAANQHAIDLAAAFKDPALREDMAFGLEPTGNPRFDVKAPDGSWTQDSFEARMARIRDHSEGGQRAIDELERQSISGQLNMQMLRDLGRLPEGTPEVENYIRRGWEPLPGARSTLPWERQWFGYRSRTGPITSNLLPREFDTLAEGIRAGRTPDTPIDYAQMVGRGDADFSRTLALHRLMQDVSELPAMADGRPAFMRMRGPGSPTEVLAALRAKVSGEAQATPLDPDFAEATRGATPLGRKITLTKQGQFLIEGAEPLTLDQARARVGLQGDTAPPPGYVETDMPLLKRAVPGKGTLYVRQELQDNMSPILSEIHSGYLGRAVDAMWTPVKQLTLFAGTFHPMELTMQNVMQRGPLAAIEEAVKRGGGLPVLNQLTRRMGWGNIQRDAWANAIRKGVAVDSPELDTNAGQLLGVQKALIRLAQATGADKAAPSLTNLLTAALGAPHDAMFPGYMAPLKVALYNVLEDKALQLRAGHDFALGPGGLLNRNAIKAMPEADLYRGIADNVNNAFGGQQWRLFENRFLADPMVQKVFQRLFLAPDWFASAVRVMGEPFSANPMTRALGVNMYLRGALYMFGGANLANYLLTSRFAPDGRGHFMVDNEPGHRLELQIGPNEFMRFLKLQQEAPDVIGKERAANWAGAAFEHLPGVGAAREVLNSAPAVAPEHFQWSPPGAELPVLGAVGRKLHPSVQTGYAMFGSHAYPSGYPSELAKAQEIAGQRGTLQMPHSVPYYLGGMLAGEAVPIWAQRLAQLRQPGGPGPAQGGGPAQEEPWWHAFLPFAISHGLSGHNAIAELGDLYRTLDQSKNVDERGAAQQRIEEIRRILESHQLGPGKAEHSLALGQQFARRFPTPTTPSGKPAPAQ